VDFDDPATHEACFRIPADVIANFELHVCRVAGWWIATYRAA
jgi:hypothetical protein